ncbi:FAD-dependent monooxygenase [Spirillospora sp. NPDC049652]
MVAVRTALVIGGGIAGPAVALALRRIGVRATVYEAHPRPADGLGGVLTLSPNGIDALRLLRAEAVIRQIGRPATEIVTLDGRGGRVGAYTLPADLRPVLNMLRSQLYQALNDHVRCQGIAIEYGKRLVGAEETAGGVRALFADGSSAHAEVLIGADGLHSAVRTLIDPSAPAPVHLPLLELYGRTDTVVPGGSAAVCIVLVRRGYLAYWRAAADQVRWYANLPLPHPMTAGQAAEQPDTHWFQRTREFYADEPFPHRLLTATDPAHTCVVGPSVMMPPLPRWHRGRMVLVGDAAHAPSSSSGQGASLAMESAVQLARCLRDLPTPAAAFEAYQRLRSPRTEHIAANAVRTLERRTSLSRRPRLARLAWPLTIRTFAEPRRTLGPIWHHRIDWPSPALAPAPSTAPLH